MKFLKNILIPLFAIAFFSCSKSFLDKRPLDQIVNSNFYQNPEQLLQGTAPLYNAVWKSYLFKVAYNVEQRANTVYWRDNKYKDFLLPSTDQQLAEGWASLFNTVGQANMVIQNVQSYTTSSVPEAAKNNALAEAHFMRAMAYYFLVQFWGPVPVIENNNTLLTDTTKRRNTIESVWELIMKDMKFAAQNLLEKEPQKGRLNKYAGQAMLARMFLTKAGVGMSGTRRQEDLDSAAYYCREVISKGPFKLMADYEELFKTKNNNNSESIFALQWVYNGGNTANATQGFQAFTSAITGFADGWGGSLGAGLNTLKMYEDLALDKRRKATYMLPGDVYSYITHLADDPANAGKKILRPLIVPTAAPSNYTPDTSNMAWIKKYVVGRPEDNDGKVMYMGTEINTYMIRLAEVYLTLAEAVLGNENSTTNAEALEAVNIIRRRAGLENLDVVTWDDIYRERILEFAMENMSASDYARLHYYNPQKAYSMLNAMYRGAYKIVAKPKVNPSRWELYENPTANLYNYATVNANNFYFPLPDAELTRAPALREDPIPYQF